MDELQHITTGVMRLVVCDIFNICPSKVRAYNSKGELKMSYFLCMFSISMMPDM